MSIRLVLRGLYGIYGISDDIYGVSEDLYGVVVQ